MLKLRKFLSIILLFSLVFTFFITRSAFATDINMNLAQEQNVTDNQNPGNNVRNETRNKNELTNTSTSPLNANTSASVQSVEQFEDNTAKFDFTNIISILLLAVGLVIILLGVAILIRLNK